MFFIEGLVYHLFTLQQGENVELIEASCVMHKNYFWITLFICRNKACVFSSIFNRCYNIMLSAVLSTFAVKNDATSCIWQYCSARLRIWQSTLELKTLTLLFFFFFFLHNSLWNPVQDSPLHQSAATDCICKDPSRLCTHGKILD